MASPRSAFLVHMANGSAPVLVLNETDAATYPGRAGSEPVVVIRGDAPDTFYRLDRSAHPFVEAPPLAFDQAAADARKAVRQAARAKLTQEERDACGLGAAE